MASEQPYPEPGLTEQTRREVMAEIDRQIQHDANAALTAHHKALMAVIDEIVSGTPRKPNDTWLIRQLKNMRVDAQLSDRPHDADVLTRAIEELGGQI